VGKCTIVLVMCLGIIRNATRRVCFGVFFLVTCVVRVLRDYSCKANLTFLSSSSTAADSFPFFSFHNIFLRSYATFS